MLFLEEVCTMFTAKQIMAHIISENRNGTSNRELDISGTWTELAEQESLRDIKYLHGLQSADGNGISLSHTTMWQ